MDNSKNNIDELTRQLNELKVRNKELELELEQVRSGSSAADDYERFKTFLQHFPHPMVLFNTNGLAAAMNKQNEQVFKLNAADVIGKYNIFEDEQAVDLGKARHFKRALSGEIAQMQPVKMILTNKSTFKQTAVWTETTYFPLYDSDGDVLFVAEINLDVTKRVNAEKEFSALRDELWDKVESQKKTLNQVINEHKQTESKLKEINELYKTLVKNLPESIVCLLDTDFRCLLADGHGLQAAGLSSSDMENRKLTEVFSDNVSVELTRALNSALNDETPILEIRHNDNFFNTTILPVKNTAGNIEQLMVLMLNVTSSRTVEKRLKESQELYRKLLLASPDAICVLDTNGTITFFSPKIRELFRVHEDIIITGLNAIDWVVPEERSQAKMNLSQIARGVHTTSNVYNCLRYDGTKFKGEINTALIQDDEGRPKGFISIIRDITQRITMQEKLRQSEETYRNIFQNAQVGLFRTRVSDGKALEANDALARMFGYHNREEILRLKNVEVIYADKNERARFIDKIVKNGEVKGFETKFVRVDGSFFFGRFSARLYKNRGYIEGVMEDITEWKKAKNALEESEKKFRSLVNNSLVGIYIIQDFILKFCNKRFAEIFGYETAEEVTDISIVNFIAPESRQTVKDNVDKRIEGGMDIARYEFTAINRDGDRFFVEVLGTKIMYENKPAIQGTMIDITDRKKSEQDLIDAKNKAEEASRLKSSFLSNMSHELRTPMNGILGFAQILELEIDDEEMLEMVQKIDRSGRRLMNTLNSILDLSILESDRSIIRKGITNIVSCLKKSYRKYEDFAVDKEIDYILDLNTDRIWCEMNEQFLTQVITNLIDNAIKFTNEGKVKVSLNYSPEDNIRGGAVLTVEDTGIGIDQKEIDVIFLEFRQASEGMSRSYEGSGLGLTIVKKMVDAVGGKIDVQSKLGEGTAFNVQLPAFSVPHPDKESGKSDTDKHKPLASKSDYDILIVEDNSINRDLIKVYLKNMGNISYAATGEEALEIARSQNFDIILMDINLGSGMNGMECAAELRKIEQYSETPIVAVTGYAMAGDKDKLLDSECTHYLPKPFSRENIRDLFSEIFSSEEEPGDN